jgi:hypothetical protein
VCRALIPNPPPDGVQMEINRKEPPKRRRIIGNILIFSMTGLLAISSIFKFLHIPKVVAEFSSLGFHDPKLTLVAILEIVSALLLFGRGTRAIGLLMASAYMGGAIATHLQPSQSPAAPAVILALIWIGVWMRHPEMGWSWRASGSPRNTDLSRVRPEFIAGS